MRKLLLVIIILLIGIGLFAQISTQRVVNVRITSAAAVGVAPADTFNVVATVKTDQLGQGYNGSQIDTADILVDQLGRQFEVYSITTQAPGSITFRAFQLQAANIAPFGNGVVQAPTGNDLRLLVPDNDNGITSALYARIFNHNINRLDTLVAANGFRADEPILRLPEVGDTVPGFDFYYFSEPTITLTLSPTTTVYEIGTSNAITLSGATTNPGAATLSGGVLTRTVPSSNTVNSFGTSTSYSQGITFTPTQAGSGDYNQQTYSFQATQDWSGSGESGTAASTTRTIRGVYPIFYGMASTDTTTVKGAIYSTLTKSVVAEGDKTYSYTGSGLIYYAFPATWGDTNLSSIIDPNGFNVTASFTRTTATVTSTGLTNNYSAVSYVVYYLNTGSTTTSASDYTFNQ